MAIVGDTYNPNANPLEYRPDWGLYRIDWEDEDMFSSNVVEWFPVLFSAEKYSIEQIYDLTQWIKENIDSIWEGPIGYLGFWKFRFTTEEDVVAVKLYM